MDADGSGAIDMSEIIEAFSHLGLAIDRDTVARLMDDIDPDGSGSLDHAEFVALMAHALYTDEGGEGRQIVASAGKVRAHARALPLSAHPSMHTGRHGSAQGAGMNAQLLLPWP